MGNLACSGLQANMEVQWQIKKLPLPSSPPQWFSGCQNRWILILLGSSGRRDWKPCHVDRQFSFGEQAPGKTHICPFGVVPMQWMTADTVHYTCPCLLEEAQRLCFTLPSAQWKNHHLLWEESWLLRIPLALPPGGYKSYEHQHLGLCIPWVYHFLVSVQSEPHCP